MAAAARQASAWQARVWRCSRPERACPAAATLGAAISTTPAARLPQGGADLIARATKAAEQLAEQRLGAQLAPGGRGVCSCGPVQRRHPADAPCHGVELHGTKMGL